MSLAGYSVLAVIPARGGSKGIPQKNLQLVAGKSLVALTAEVTHRLPWLDECVLSTDDTDIATEGRRAGLPVPFLRPAVLATDTALAIDVWRHAWSESERHFGCRFDCSVLLQPTSPLRTPEDVTTTLEAMISGGHRAAATVSRVPGHYVPEKQLLIKDGVLCFMDGVRPVSNRQMAGEYYIRNGLCYAAMRQTVVEMGKIIEIDCVPVISHGYVANIDDPFDLGLANLMASGLLSPI